MIQIQDISFEYKKEQGTLSHIDLNIHQGECIVLIGESGCGKTTVTKLVNGLIPHFVEGGTLFGRAIVNGMEVAKTEMYSIVKRKNKYSVVYAYFDEAGKRRQRWETFDTKGNRHNNCRK